MLHYTRETPCTLSCQTFSSSAFCLNAPTDTLVPPKTLYLKGFPIVVEKCIYETLVFYEEVCIYKKNVFEESGPQTTLNSSKPILIERLGTKRQHSAQVFL